MANIYKSCIQPWHRLLHCTQEDVANAKLRIRFLSVQLLGTGGVGLLLLLSSISHMPALLDVSLVLTLLAAVAAAALTRRQAGND